MTRLDQTIDRAADKLQELADKAAGQNGLKGKLAEPLAEDAAFLRKLKPSLIAARARGNAPTDEKPASGQVTPVAPPPKAKLAAPLAEDAAFLRKLKPSLVAARARGDAPTDEKPGSGTVPPSEPKLDARPKPKRHGGPNPWLVAAGALVAGIALAKLIDWRGHAHPRD